MFVGMGGGTDWCLWGSVLMWSWRLFEMGARGKRSMGAQ